MARCETDYFDAAAELAEKRLGLDWPDRVYRVRELIAEYGGVEIFRILQDAGLGLNVPLVCFLDAVAEAFRRPLEEDSAGKITSEGPKRAL